MAVVQLLTGAAARVATHCRLQAQDTRTRGMLVIGAVLTFLFGAGLFELVRLSFVRWQLDRRLASLEAERAQLTLEQQRLQSDPAYVEGLIRSTFKVAQPGEFVVPLAPASGDQHR